MSWKILRSATSCLSSASNLLPQQKQMFGKSSRSSQESKAKTSHLHVPTFPTRQGIKRPSLSINRQNNSPHQEPILERGGGTGRREAITSRSKDVPRTTVSAFPILNSHTTSRLNTRQYTQSRIVHFKELVHNVS